MPSKSELWYALAARLWRRSVAVAGAGPGAAALLLAGGTTAYAFTPLSPRRPLRLPASANHVNGQLNAITCLPNGFCAAIGGYTSTLGRFQAMALVKPAGHGWQQTTEVLPPTGASANPHSYLNALACPSAGHCIAVGTYRVPTSSSKAMGAVSSASGRRRRCCCP